VAPRPPEQHLRASFGLRWSDNQFFEAYPEHGGDVAGFLKSCFLTSNEFAKSRDRQAGFPRDAIEPLLPATGKLIAQPRHAFCEFTLFNHSRNS
jgi:hypothetical protein